MRSGHTSLSHHSSASSPSKWLKMARRSDFFASLVVFMFGAWGIRNTSSHDRGSGQYFIHWSALVYGSLSALRALDDGALHMCVCFCMAACLYVVSMIYQKFKYPVPPIFFGSLTLQHIVVIP